MDETSINSAPAENAPLSIEQGADALAALFARKPDEANPKEPQPTANTTQDDEPDEDADLLDALEDGEPEAEDPADETPEETTYKLPDGTVVTLQELTEWRQGHLRQADYTRKTQELAEQRKATEAKLAEAAHVAARYSEQLDLAISVATAYLPPDPDASMLQTDPIGYIQAKEAREAEISRLNGLYAAKQQHEAQQAEIQKQEFQKWAAQEQERLVERLPELKDPAKQQEFTKDIIQFLPHYGYTQDDLKHLYDHRQIVLISDAVKYQKLLARRPTAVDKAKTAPPVQPTGRRGSPLDQRASAQKSAVDQLRKTGSLEAGAAAFLALSKGR